MHGSRLGTPSPIALDLALQLIDWANEVPLTSCGISKKENTVPVAVVFRIDRQSNKFLWTETSFKGEKFELRADR